MVLRKAIEMKKIKVKLNKPAYLGLSILGISKTLMYDFGMIILNQNIGLMHDYVIWIQAVLLLILRQKISIKILKMIKDYDTSNYEVNRPLSTVTNKKAIGLIKDELGGKIMTEFAALRPKTYSHLMDDGNSDKKLKEQRNV